MRAAQAEATAGSKPADTTQAYTSPDLVRALGHTCPTRMTDTTAPEGAIAREDRCRWAWWIATFFGTGYLKPGPGTYGSVAAAGLWLIAGWVVHHDAITLTWITAAAIVVSTAFGIPAATRVAREGGRKDPGYVVIDEVAGQWVALLLTPPLWPNVLVAVLLFRFFDILKPWPIRRFEALPEGTGIVADDLVAGLFALACTQLILYFLEPMR